LESLGPEGIIFPTGPTSLTNNFTLIGHLENPTDQTPERIPEDGRPSSLIDPQLLKWLDFVNYAAADLASEIC
jgi:hypothetical protein